MKKAFAEKTRWTTTPRSSDMGSDHVQNLETVIKINYILNIYIIISTVTSVTKNPTK